MATAVGPTPEYLAACAASANYAMECNVDLYPDFAPMAVAAIIEQCCGKAGEYASKDMGMEDPALAAVENLKNAGIQLS